MNSGKPDKLLVYMPQYSILKEGDYKTHGWSITDLFNKFGQADCCIPSTQIYKWECNPTADYDDRLTHEHLAGWTLYWITDILILSFTWVDWHS